MIYVCERMNSLSFATVKDSSKLPGLSPISAPRSEGPEPSKTTFGSSPLALCLAGRFKGNATGHTDLWTIINQH